DIDLEPDELGRDLGEALVASFPPAILDRDVATIDPPKFAQSLHKRGGPFASGRTGALAQESDGRQLCCLLRPRRERPRGRAAEQRDEVAPFHGPVSPVLLTEERIAHLSTAGDCCGAGVQSWLWPLGVSFFNTSVIRVGSDQGQSWTYVRSSSKAAVGNRALVSAR